jgi:L-lactate utilization protein LutB
MVDYVQGKVLHALTKGCTEAIDIAIKSSGLPEALKKFASKSLTNVDEMIEESLVLQKMGDKFEEVKPSAIEAVKRPDAKSTPEKKEEKVEERPISGKYE